MGSIKMDLQHRIKPQNVKPLQDEEAYNFVGDYVPVDDMFRLLKTCNSWGSNRRGLAL